MTATKKDYQYPRYVIVTYDGSGVRQDALWVTDDSQEVERWIKLTNSRGHTAVVHQRSEIYQSDSPKSEDVSDVKG